MPSLSIIIPSFNSRATIGRCLQSLFKQQTDKTFEIIVTDSSNDGTGQWIEENFPEVKLMSSPERLYPGGARNLAIAAASANLLACIDADCYAPPNWLDSVWQAHQSGDLAIGGAIGCGNPESWIGWVYYFCEFSHWMPTAPGRHMDDIPAASMTYKRTVFERFGRFVEGTYCSDTLLHWRLARAKQPLKFDPDIVIYHNNPDNLRSLLRHEFFHGRTFGRVRAADRGFSRWQRWAYALLFPIAALKIFSNVALNNLRTRVYLLHFLKACPLVLLGVSFWAAGEAVGCIWDFQSDPAGGRQ